jgi:hypothetical protein
MKFMRIRLTNVLTGFEPGTSKLCHHLGYSEFYLRVPACFCCLHILMNLEGLQRNVEMMWQ